MQRRFVDPGRFKLGFGFRAGQGKEKGWMSSKLAGLLLLLLLVGVVVGSFVVAVC